MIDHANIEMKSGACIASERIEGRDDNMSCSHFHEFYELYYLESGARTYIINDVEYKVEPGSIVLLPPYTMHHSFSPRGIPFCRLLVYFSKDAIEAKIYNHLLHTQGVFTLRNSQQTSEIHRMLETVLNESSEKNMYSELSAKSALSLALVMLLRNGSRNEKEVKDDKITLILRYLADHYMDEITLDDLCEKFYISKFFLCRQFKKYTKTTVLEYLSTVRVLNAQRLFMESDKNLSDIANLVGFNSLGNFERTFKKITGSTPRNSLKMYRIKKTGSNNRGSRNSIQST